MKNTYKVAGLALIALLIASGCAKDTSPTIPVEIQMIKVGKHPHSLAKGSVTNQVFVSCFGSNNVMEIDIKSLSVKNEFPVLEGPGFLIEDKAAGRVLALHTKQNGFALLYTNPAKLKRTVKTGRLNLTGGAVRPGYNEMWISDGQTKLNIFTRQFQIKRKNVTLGRYPQNVVFTRGNSLAVVTLKGENAISLVDTKERKELERIKVGIYPRDLVITGNKACVSNYGSNDISLVDLIQKKEIARIGVRKKPNALALRKNTLWVACEKSYRLVAINVSTAKVIGTVRLGFYPGDVIAMKDGSLIVTAPRENKIAIIKPEQVMTAKP